jgi:hypothetical protein
MINSGIVLDSIYYKNLLDYNTIGVPCLNFSSNNIWLGSQIVKLLIKQLFSSLVVLNRFRTT